MGSIRKLFSDDLPLELRRDALTGAHAWIEESFLKNPAISEGASKHPRAFFLGHSVHRHTGIFFFVFLILIWGALLGRIFFLQIIQGKSYQIIAEENRERRLSLPAERGIISDRNGAALSKNIPNFSIAILPQELPASHEKRAEVFQYLSGIIGETPEDVEAYIASYGAYRFESIIIKEDIPYETALSLMTKREELPGVTIHRGSKRFYLTEGMESLSHVLGYIGKLTPEELKELRTSGYTPSDLIGKTGIEKSYEQSLRGVYGEKKIEVNALGKEQLTLSEIAPTPGFALSLTIDGDMQKMLERIMREQLKQKNKQRAAGIVMDPKTGEIRAMVSIPSYQNNDFSGGIDASRYQAYIKNEEKPLFNRAIAGVY
ncbi:MAG: hypothetical protein AAB932_03155, partial [Patescibacteria group bacterium]